MTSIERVSLALRHKEADRIPIHDGPWGTTVARWRREGLPEDQSPTSYFGYEFRGFGANESLLLPTKVIEDTDEYVIARIPCGAITCISFRCYITNSFRYTRFVLHNVIIFFHSINLTLSHSFLASEFNFLCNSM